MPLKFYLAVLGLAIAAAALTIAAALWLLPDAPWVGPAVMAVLGSAALAVHLWTGRK